MTSHPVKNRIRIAAVTLLGIAAVAGAAWAAATPGAAAAPRQPMAMTSAVGLPVVVDCAVHGQTRPGQYTLACADGNASLSGLHWASWGSSAAFAEGVSAFDDCVPNCVTGHGHSFPVLVDLWRAEPRPGHPGQRYFTRLTLIYTGNRTYTAGGHQYHLPQTVTYPLSAFGGA